MCAPLGALCLGASFGAQGTAQIQNPTRSPALAPPHRSPAPIKVTGSDILGRGAGHILLFSMTCILSELGGGPRTGRFALARDLKFRVVGNAVARARLEGFRNPLPIGDVQRRSAMADLDLFGEVALPPKAAQQKPVQVPFLSLDMKRTTAG